MAKVASKVEDVTEVTLTMTTEEASAVFTLIGRVAGSSTGPRGVTEKVYKALKAVGVKPIDYSGLNPQIIRWEPKKKALPTCGISSCNWESCKPKTDNEDDPF